MTPAEWAARYFEAWKSNDRAMVESLFTEDAVYYYGPFRPPATGREEIVQRWIENVPPDNVRTTHEIVATSGDTSVIRWTVTFDATEMDGVLIVTFDAHGRCREHREWYAQRTVDREA